MPNMFWTLTATVQILESKNYDNGVQLNWNEDFQNFEHLKVGIKITLDADFPTLESRSLSQNGCRYSHDMNVGDPFELTPIYLKCTSLSL